MHEETGIFRKMYNKAYIRTWATLCLSAILLVVLLPNRNEHAREPRVHPRALLGHPSRNQQAVWEPLFPDLSTSLHEPLKSLFPRQDPDPDFAKAQDRGKKLLCYLQNPDSAPQTKWNKYDEIADWGWTLKVRKDIFMVGAAFEGAEKATKDMGLSVDAPPNVNYHWVHNRETVHDGITYPVRPSNVSLWRGTGYTYRC